MARTSKRSGNIHILYKSLICASPRQRKLIKQNCLAVVDNNNNKYNNKENNNNKNNNKSMLLKSQKLQGYLTNITTWQSHVSTDTKCTQTMFCFLTVKLSCAGIVPLENRCLHDWVLALQLTAISSTISHHKHH